MSALPELRPAVEELPEPFRVDQIDPGLCYRFSRRALPIFRQASIAEHYELPDSDPILSELTDEIIAAVGASSGAFAGPVRAKNTLRGFESARRLSSTDQITYHVDGATEDVAIVPLSGLGRWYLTWLPSATNPFNRLGGAYDSDTRFSHDDPDKVQITIDDEPIGFVRPVKTITCTVGRVLRINQAAGVITDTKGVEWELNHGLFDVVGARVALTIRKLEPEEERHETRLRSVPNATIG